MSARRRPPGAAQRLTPAARAFLDAHAVGHLATAGADGTPHAVPLCYARLGGRLYFVADDKPKRHGPRRLQRLANLSANPRAALLVDDYDDDWSRLAYLLLHCDAAPVEAGAEYAAALAALRRRYPPYRRMRLRSATHPMIRLTPRRWHLWRAAGQAPVVEGRAASELPGGPAAAPPRPAATKRRPPR